MSDELIKHWEYFLLLLKHLLTLMHCRTRGSKLRDSVFWGRAPEMLQISALVFGLYSFFQSRVFVQCKVMEEGWQCYLFAFPLVGLYVTTFSDLSPRSSPDLIPHSSLCPLHFFWLYSSNSDSEAALLIADTTVRRRGCAENILEEIKGVRCLSWTESSKTLAATESLFPGLLGQY